MALLTIALGILLILLSAGGYHADGGRNWLLVVPSFFGAAILLTGLVGLIPRCRKHAIYIANAVAIICYVPTSGGWIELPELLRGAEIEEPVLVIVRSTIAILCCAFAIVCIKSFVDARHCEDLQAK